MRIGLLLLSSVVRGLSLQIYCSNALLEEEVALLIRSDFVSCLERNCFHEHFVLYPEVNGSTLTIYANRTEATAANCTEIGIEEMAKRGDVVLLKHCLSNSTLPPEGDLLLRPENECDTTLPLEEAFYENLKRCHKWSATVAVGFSLLTFLCIAVTVNRVKAICFVFRIPVVTHSTVVYRSIEEKELERTQPLEEEEVSAKVPEHTCADSIVKFSPFPPVRKRKQSETKKEDSEQSRLFMRLEDRSLRK
ncbi:hypothetical protein QR680_005804 [Steinernema hermaphroditum]|uniref:Uncharacterized protein n=1 Tax=Steinernema hermaphroditum TaxID=289476 RepID=A0AA39HVK3_9BILA|nr:hypothetical protein QR680_005804 [Steinernema hermaphroditum]